MKDTAGRDEIPARAGLRDRGRDQTITLILEVVVLDEDGGSCRVRHLSYDFIFLVDTFLIISNWFGYQIGVYLFMTVGINQRIVIGLGGLVSLVGVFCSSYT